MKTKYMRIRLTEAEDAIIRDKAKQAGGTLTEYIVGVITKESVITKPVVITNVPTKKVAMDALNKKFEKQTTEKASIEHTTPIVKKNASVKTISKALNKQLKGSDVTIEQDRHTCSTCSNKIKKGFLCNDCLK